MSVWALHRIASMIYQVRSELRAWMSIRNRRSRKCNRELAKLSARGAYLIQLFALVPHWI